MRKKIDVISPNGVYCNTCKNALPVDIKHNKYYCLLAQAPNRNQIVNGDHFCESAENRKN